jgi:hypothetical protein
VINLFKEEGKKEEGMAFEKKPIQPDKLYSYDEIAELSGMTYEEIENRIQTKKVELHRVNDRNYIKGSDLRLFFDLK